MSLKEIFGLIFWIFIIFGLSYFVYISAGTPFSRYEELIPYEKLRRDHLIGGLLTIWLPIIIFLLLVLYKFLSKYSQ